MKTTLAYNYINKTRDNPKCGVGVAIGIDKNLTFRDISHLILANLHEGLEIVFV
jgi:hypothetical protein